MYIEQLDKQRLLITLAKDELSLFTKNDPDTDSDTSQKLFAGFLSLAAVKAGISLLNKRLTVELLPGIDSFFLIITITPQRKLSAGRLSHLCVSFQSAGDLIGCAERLKLLKTPGIVTSSLYRHEHTYYLVLTASSQRLQSFLPLFAEYGRVKQISKRQMMHIDEFADSIVRYDALDQFC